MEASNFLNHLEEALSQFANLDFDREGSAISVNTQKMDQPELWLNFSNEKELILGIDVCYKVFYNEGDKWNQGMIEFLCLLSRPITVEIYKKRDFPFRNTYSYLDRNNSESRLTAMTWLYPYWRKSVVESVTFPPMVAEEALLELRNRLINAA